MKKWNTIIFDLDGTLFDTSEGIACSIQYTLKQLKLSIPQPYTIADFIGPPIQQSFQTLVGLSTEEAQFAGDIFRTRYSAHDFCLSQLYPGMAELLVKLKERGYKLGVATYKREDYAVKLLKNFNVYDLFDVVHVGDNENKLKKEDIIMLCLDELKEQAFEKSTVMIGDTKHDESAAEKIRIDFIGVSYGFGYKKGDQLPNKILVSSTYELYDIFLT